MLVVPIIQRCQLCRANCQALPPAGDRTDGNRRIGRPERRNANSRNGLAALRSKQAKRVDIGRLPLVRTHAQCRITFEQFRGAVALDNALLQVGDSDVVLNIGKALALGLNPTAGGNVRVFAAIRQVDAARRKIDRRQRC